LVILGGAILGKVAGDLIVTDPLVRDQIKPFSNIAEWVVPIFLAVVIPIVARWKEVMSRLGGERPHPKVVKGVAK
ncbi:MAG TPA: hypothetical protein VN203_12450, partial [Candidatus Acidoferrum sp.]|nr:hypothetical protein [Candidatus Acidoferrum sp.]